MDARRNGLIFGAGWKLGTALTRAFADGWSLRAADRPEADDRHEQSESRDTGPL